MIPFETAARHQTLVQPSRRQPGRPFKRQLGSVAQDQFHGPTATLPGVAPEANGDDRLIE